MTNHLRILVSGATRTVKRLAPHPNLGQLITPQAGNRVLPGMPWAADNAAYSNWDSTRFLRMLDRITGLPHCLFVTVPDAVGDAAATLRRWGDWRQVTATAGHPLAFVAQDGIEATNVPWDEFAVLFVGGTDAYKCSRASIRIICQAVLRGKRVHIGRVNSKDRLLWAFEHGAHSVDGTCFSMFPDSYLPRYLEQLQAWECQRWFAL